MFNDKALRKSINISPVARNLLEKAGIINAEGEVVQGKNLSKFISALIINACSTQSNVLIFELLRCQNERERRLKEAEFLDKHIEEIAQEIKQKRGDDAQ